MKMADTFLCMFCMVLEMECIILLGEGGGVHLVFATNFGVVCVSSCLGDGI